MHVIGVILAIIGAIGISAILAFVVRVMFYKEPDFRKLHPPVREPPL